VISINREDQINFPNGVVISCFYLVFNTPQCWQSQGCSCISDFTGKLVSLCFLSLNDVKSEVVCLYSRGQERP